MGRTNLAYDLSRYENSIVKEQPKPVIKAKKVQQKAVSVPKTFAAILFIGFIMCCILYGKVETNRVYNEIAAQNKAVDILYSENVRMQAEYEGRTSIKNVEDYAVNVLGLKKLDKAQIEYVQLQTENIVEIPENDSNIFVKIQNKFYEILEYLQG